MRVCLFFNRAFNSHMTSPPRNIASKNRVLLNSKEWLGNVGLRAARGLSGEGKGVIFIPHITNKPGGWKGHLPSVYSDHSYPFCLLLDSWNVWTLKFQLV